MEAFLYIVGINDVNISTTEMKNQIDNLKGTAHFFNINKKDQSVYIYYTNEYDEYPYKKNDRFSFCPIGELTVSREYLFKRLLELDDEKKSSFVSKLNGSFLISLADFHLNEVDIYTHVARIENAYIYKSDDYIVVGSDPLIVSTFSNKECKPQFDPLNFISFFESGHFSDDLTPYENVVCLPANTHVKIKNNKVSYTPIDDVFDHIMTKEPDRNLNLKLSESFLEGMNILPEKDIIKLGITGGKDSRILLASLVKKDFNINTHTNGFGDHPDVVIGEKLSEYYGIPHKINEPQLAEEKTLDINLHERLLETMKATSGQIFAYENIGNNKNFRRQTIISGVGGEILRGGYHVSNLGSNNGDKLLKNKFSKYENIYLLSQTPYSNYLSDLIQSEDNYLKVFFKHYLIYRMGRWSGDSRKAKNYAARNYMPFLDNQLVKIAMQVKPEILMTGKLHFNLLKEIDNNLTKFRFEKLRYRFEEKLPEKVEEYEEWFSRRPLYPQTEIGKYNWRILDSDEGSNLIKAFSEILLADRNHLVYDVVDYNKVEEILHNNFEKKYNVLIWSLASMIVFINYINNKIPDHRRSVELDIPRDKIEKPQGTKVLVNLLEQFNNPTSTVSIRDKEGQGNLISVNNQKWNPYIKTFKGHFNQIPSNEKSIIKDAKSIRVNVTFGSVPKDTNVYLILYSDKSKIDRKKLAMVNSNDLITFDEEISLTDDCHYYRIIITLPPKSNKKYTLYYSFVEIKY